MNGALSFDFPEREGCATHSALFFFFSLFYFCLQLFFFWSSLANPRLVLLSGSDDCGGFCRAESEECTFHTWVAVWSVLIQPLACVSS